MTSKDRRQLKRRDVLKAAGAVGAINAFGTGIATAKQSRRRIVGTRPGRADEARQKANQVINTLDFDDIGQAVVGRWPKEALQGLEHNPNIRYIEEDGVVTLLNHEGKEKPDEVLDWGDDRIDVGAAHAAGHMGDGINVAIVDSGIDSQHEDLVDNLHDSLHVALAECDFDCNDNLWHDDEGHGTAVAGIVGAVHTDSDVIGVAPEVTLHAVKVFPSSGDTFPSKLAAGIEWVADNGMDVANMSVKLPDGHNQCVEDAMAYARKNDVVLVVAAGNSGGSVLHPAVHEESFTVSGITELDELATYSSRGEEVDIAAPTESGSGQDGRGILTTRLDGGTTRFSGTSAAAPHVAGAAALLRADGTSDDNVESDLENTAEDLGLDATKQGAGLLDVANSFGLDSVNDLLEAETDYVDPTSSSTEAHLNGKLSHLIGSDSAEVFFEYRTEGSNTWTKTSTETLTGTVPFDSSKSFDRTITGLTEGTRYDFRAGATVEHSGKGWSSTEHGSILTFEAGTNLVPTASFTHDPIVPNPGEDIEFDASESINPEGDLTYEWDFEDDGSFDDTGKIVTHSYSNPGDVTVRLRVTDENNQTDETTETLRVNAPPEAAFTHSPTEPDENETVTFDASDSSDSDGSIVKYEWDFDEFIDFEPDESTTSATTTHTYVHGEDKSVTLRVTDNNGASSTTTKQIHVNRRPFSEIDFSPTEPNEDEPVTFDGSDSTDFDGSVEKYEWDWDYDGSTFDPDKSTDSAMSTHTFTEGGDKTVALRVTDDDGAKDDFLATESFHVNHTPTATFSHSPTEPNEGEQVSFDASGASDQDGTIETYEWDFDDDGSFDDATGVNPSHTYPEGGDKTVGLRITDDKGASTKKTKTIHVNAFPTASFTHSPSEPTEDTSVTFDASGSSDSDGSIAIYEWDWDFDGSTFDADETSSGAMTSHTFADGGEKTVALRVTDDDDATSNLVSETFHVNHRPTASFTHSPSEPTEDTSVTFDASGSSDSDGSIATYEWDWDYDGSTFDADETSSGATVTHMFADGGDKTVALRVTDDDGATSNIVSDIFHVNHRPTASFTVSPNPVVRNEVATFDASSSSDSDGSIATYEWDWNYDGSAFKLDERTHSKTITHTFTEGGKQTVALRVIDNDGARSEPEVVTHSFTVYIKVDITIQPDGNGRNIIKSTNKGVVPVGVVHTKAFDSATRLDPTTVHFGDPDDVGFDGSNMPEGGARPAHSGGHLEDVDEDGDKDALFHFPIQAADFDSDDTRGEIAGLTKNGVPVFGSDSVHII